MKTWRLEHPTKDMFFEVFWDNLEVELVSGTIGSEGKTRHVGHGSPRDAERFIAAELAKRRKQGFEEVAPEVPIEIARTAPIAPPAPALVAEIAAQPDDDAVRLVYADYLLGHGDPLGELIVVQCERARLPRWDRRHERLAAREDTLLMTFRPRWLGAIAKHVSATFVRGFVDRIGFGGADPRDRVLDHVFDIAPLLTTLVIPASVAPNRAGSEDALARLTGVVLEGSLYTNSVELWMLPHVVRFTAADGAFGTDPMRDLAMRAWRELVFGNLPLGADGTRAMLDRLDPEVLEVLELIDCGVTDAGIARIVERPLPALRRLGLRGAQLSPRALERIAGARDLRAVTHLDLSLNAEAGAGLPALVESRALPALRELSLRHVPLDADDMAALARSPIADRLVSLDLESCALDEAAAESLVDGAWPALRELRIHGNPLGAGGALIRERFPDIHW